MTHTKGPWHVTPDENDGEMCFVSTNMKEAPFPRNWVACCCTACDDKEWTANAHLIAAAPNMLDALRGMIRMSELSGTDDRIIHALALSAIAKAEGK